MDLEANGYERYGSTGSNILGQNCMLSCSANEALTCGELKNQLFSISRLHSKEIYNTELAIKALIKNAP